MNQWLYKKKSGKKLLFLFTSIDLDPKIKISNISASMCSIFMILGSLNLSHVVLARSSGNIVIYITDHVYYAFNCTRVIYIWLWGLLKTFSDLFHVCPLFLAMVGVCACVCVYVHACVRVCVCECVRAGVPKHIANNIYF